MLAGQFRTIDEILRERASAAPDQVVLTYLRYDSSDDTGRAYESASLTFAQLDRRVSVAAAVLLAEPSTAGSVLLLHPPGLEFIVSFFACIRAGAIAVPTSVPIGRRGAERLSSIVHDAGILTVMTQSSVGIDRRFAVAIPDLRTIITDELPEPDHFAADPFDAYEPRPEPTALLQYTSGSTSTPKGVVVTHGNLLHNQQVISDSFGHSADSTVVTWLPHFHDMGLACLLQAVYCGCRTVLFSPVQFLSRPARWLRAVSDFSATTSGGPDFAYSLASGIPAEELDGVELSSWAAAFNGSEPIKAATIRNFTEAHRQRGFTSRAMLTCFGLAESTLMVTAKDLGAEPTVLAFDAVGLEQNIAADAVDVTGVTLVGCGTPRGQRVAVVDPAGFEVPDNHVGEIWVSGASVGAGYFGQPELSEEVFGARLTDTPDVPFLRTGDLGFLRHGELFVTGRLKDLIILRGANHYPQDIEATAEAAHSDVVPGRVIAFGEQIDGAESLVVVADVRRDTAALAQVANAIRRSVSEAHGVSPGAVVLTPMGTVPTTTSGKLRRAACRSAYQAGGLRALHTLDDRGTAQAVAGRTLDAWLESYLTFLGGGDFVRSEASTAAYFDSLAALVFCRELERSWGVRVGVVDLLRTRTVGELQSLVLGSSASPAADPVAALEPTAGFPLSPAQEGIWYLDQHSRSRSAWAISRTFRISGPIDRHRLAQAFDALLDRHPALRTNVIDGDPVHQVLRPATAGVLRVWPDPVTADELPPLPELDLRTDPLLRADLMATREGGHILIVTVHHIAVDLWSLHQLLSELDVLLSGDRELAPSSAGSYAQYAVRSQSVADPVRRAAAAEYWVTALEGGSTALDLAPVNDTRSATTAAVSAHVRIDVPTHRAVEELARRNGVTPYTAYLAVFYLVMAQRSGKSDLVLGSPVSARNRPELWDVVGCFMQPSAIRIAGDRGRSFVELLDQVSRLVIGCLEHADSLPKFLAEQLSWDHRATPETFDAVLLWQQALPGTRADIAGLAVAHPGAVARMAGQDWELLSDARTAPRFKVELSLSPSEGEVLGVLVCDRAYFSQQGAETLLEQFRSALDRVIEAPAERLAALLSPPLHQLSQVLAWGTPPAPAPSGRPAPGPEGTSFGTLHQRMRRWAESAPEQVALLWGDERISYGSLGRSADAAAALLRSCTSASEEVVAVLMEDSPGLVSTLFGVLGAGKAFVCLDVDGPAERLRTVLDEARCRTVVVDELRPRSNAAQADVLRELGVNRITCDRSGGLRSERTVPEPADRAVDEQVTPRAPAFVAYTSGSSGKPKGVVQSHESFAQFLDWQSGAFDLRPGRRMAHWASTSYDASYCEIFGALCYGATLWMAPKALRHDPQALLAELETAEVNILQTVPSFLRQLLAEVEETAAQRLTSLTHLFSAGEVLTPDLAARSRRLLPHTELTNLYGPTESVLAAYHPVEDGDLSKRAIPLGRPIDGRQILLLDKDRNPVPVDVIGEVHLVSDTLALGYLNDPELTSRMFLPAPGGTPGRMYRTGDLARWTSDGELLFAGRKDGQLKVRGMRVEVGEIEAALSAHPNVVHCAVRPRAGASAVRLEAHVVVTVPTAVEDLRLHLTRRLPTHMIPARFRVTASLPLTRSGKIDREALPEIEPPRAAHHASRQSVDGTERQLVEIWKNILDLGHIDVEDDFFALGGESIAAMRLANRVRTAFAIQLPLTAVFDSPTLDSYAAAVREERLEAAAASSRIELYLDYVRGLDDAELDTALERLATA